MSALDLLMSELTPEQRAAVEGQKPRAKKTNGAKSGPVDSAWQHANDLDSAEVGDWLGLRDGGNWKCPHCESTSGFDPVRSGFKCLHDRCAGRGSEGFLSNVDMVAELRGLEPWEAVNELAARFGFDPLPEREPRKSGDGKAKCPPPDDDYVYTDADAPDAPPAPTDDEQAPTEDAAATGDPADVIASWLQEGSLVRYATSIDALDKLCKGGLPFPWRAVIVGAPSAGKTYLLVCIAYTLLKRGVAVGLLCVDEEPEDVLLRFGVLLGFSESELEARSEDTLRRLGEAVSELPLRLYGADDTIPTAAAQLEAFRQARGLAHAMLGVDSLQAVCPSTPADTPRAIVESNVRDLRAASHRYRLLSIATSEANRGFYKSRNDDSDDAVSALAAGAESRAIEFGAKTVIGLRTPKGGDDVAEVEVAKNRRHYRGKFFLKLHRSCHELVECEDPEGTPEATQERKDSKRRANLAVLHADGRELARIIQRQQGLGERDLRSAVKIAGHKWGKDYLDTLKALLASGELGVRLVNRGPHPRQCQWHVEPVEDARGDHD